MEHQDLQSLLRRHEPRREPPDEVRARVLAAVENEWRRHKRRRWRLPLALAATLMLAVAAGLLVTLRVEPVEVYVAESHGLWIDGALHRGGSIVVPPRARLTVDGPTRLVTDQGLELRLREDTRLTWLRPATLQLEAGSLYVATGGRTGLEVRTPMGVVRDIGTTFLVTLEGETLEVALREGAAAVATAHGTYTARSLGDHRGEVVTVSAERIIARPEPAAASRWAWTHRAHPGYRERRLVPLLRAVARDLGKPLEFATPEVEAWASQVRLEGDLEDVGPEQALEVVLATTALARLHPEVERLVVGFQSPEDSQ